MPYFGGVTLDVLLDKLADSLPETAICPCIADLRTASAFATGPAIKILEQLSFEKSICWICLNLAEALHDAHECGLVHFDLKPSNVLIAADGQPMLLDFHLARPPIRTQGPLPDHLGGTPGYIHPNRKRPWRLSSPGQDCSAGGSPRRYLCVGPSSIKLLAAAYRLNPASQRHCGSVTRASARACRQSSKNVWRHQPPRLSGRQAVATISAGIHDQPLVGVGNHDWAEPDLNGGDAVPPPCARSFF